MFVRKKLWFILHFRTLGTFIVGGSPMLKTVKSGSGIRVDPPPVFFKIPTFSPFIFLLTSLRFVSSVRSSSGYHGLIEIRSAAAKPLFQIFQILQILK